MHDLYNDNVLSHYRFSDANNGILSFKKITLSQFQALERIKGFIKSRILL